MSALDVIASLRTLTEAQQVAVSLWGSWVESDIERAAVSAGKTFASLNPVQVERFSVEAITYRLDHPDDATQVDVSVDDARVSRRYSSSTGQLTYLPQWWAWLGLGDDTAGAFSITPAFES